MLMMLNAFPEPISNVHLLPVLHSQVCIFKDHILTINFSGILQVGRLILQDCMVSLLVNTMILLLIANWKENHKNA